LVIVPVIWPHKPAGRTVTKPTSRWAPGRRFWLIA
jgi:hypothetical protein